MNEDCNEGETNKQNVHILDKLQKSVKEIVSNMGVLNETLVADLTKSNEQTLQVLNALNLIEDSLGTRSSKTDKLLVQLAKTVNTARDEAYNEKEELASLLHNTYLSQMEKMNNLSGELLEIEMKMVSADSRSTSCQDKSNYFIDISDVRGRSVSNSTTLSNNEEMLAYTG